MLFDCVCVCVGGGTEVGDRREGPGGGFMNGHDQK